MPINPPKEPKAVKKCNSQCSSKDVQGLGIRSVLDLRVLKKSCKREELAQAREEQEGRAKRLKAAVSGLGLAAD